MRFRAEQVMKRVQKIVECGKSVRIVVLRARCVKGGCCVLCGARMSVRDGARGGDVRET